MVHKTRMTDRQQVQHRIGVCHQQWPVWLVCPWNHSNRAAASEHVRAQSSHFKTLLRGPRFRVARRQIAAPPERETCDCTVTWLSEIAAPLNQTRPRHSPFLLSFLDRRQRALQREEQYAGMPHTTHHPVPGRESAAARQWRERGEAKRGVSARAPHVRHFQLGRNWAQIARCLAPATRPRASSLPWRVRRRYHDHGPRPRVRRCIGGGEACGAPQTRRAPRARRAAGGRPPNAPAHPSRLCMPFIYICICARAHTTL